MRLDSGLIIELWNKGMLWDKLIGTHWLPLMSVKHSNQVGTHWLPLMSVKHSNQVGTTCSSDERETL